MENDKLLGRHKLPQLSQEEIHSLNSMNVFKKFLKSWNSSKISCQRKKDQIASLRFYQAFKEEIIPILKPHLGIWKQRNST